MARSPWLLSDPAFNGNFSRKWCEPDWVLRWDLRESRNRPPDKRRGPGAVAAARRPTNESILDRADCNRHDRASEARRIAERLFSRDGAS